MQALCGWIERSEPILHPAVTGALAHYNMVRIHPFDDGNGRGARLLMNLILMRRGYPPAIIRNDEREDYLDALDQADRGDMGPFVELTVRALVRTEKMMMEELGGGADDKDQPRKKSASHTLRARG
jgi:Fic family protein